MVYNVDFEICTAIFLGLLIIISSTRIKVEGYQSWIYRAYLYLTFFNCILNALTTYALPYYDSISPIFNWGANMAFLSIQMVLPVIFIMYLYKKLPDVTERESRIIRFSLIPSAIGVILTLSSPLTKLIYYFDDMGYHHGKIHIYLYVNFVFYVFMAFYLAMRWRKQLSKRDIPLLFSMIGVNIATVVIQFMFPTVMLAGLGAGLSVFLMYFMVENNVSLIDSVTGSLNRSALTERVKRLERSDKSEELYAVAPDNFKIINEIYGLEGGNLILRSMAHELQEEFGEKNVFRFAGDTFVVLTSPEEKKNSKDIFRKFTSFFYHIGDSEVRLSACVGMVHTTNHGSDDLISALEYAVAEAKARGKGQFFEVEETAAEEMVRKTAIEQAMMENIKNGHFEVHYQLIYDLKRQGFYSMEALARLNVPGYGYISPEEFIKIAERNGSITQLGIIVLEEVCRFIKEDDLHELGIDFVEVNLSMIQCMQQDIHKDVLRTLQKYQIPTHMINFEVTESVAAASEELLIRNMERFTEQRIHLSLDDYGSGYSNINYLVDLPFSIVKIDKYVVWAAMKNETSRIILENTIRTFRNIGLRVVAEGIENEEMVEMIRNMGADYIQGFFYSKPCPKDQIVERLKAEKKKKEADEADVEEEGK